MRHLRKTILRCLACCAAAVPSAAVAAQDADVHNDSTRASVVGFVLRADSNALSNGVALHSGTANSAPIRNGSFVLRGIPSGKQEITVHAIGYAPSSYLVDVKPPTTRVRITLGQRIQALAAVSVTGAQGKDLETLAAIAERSRVGAGTMFLPGNDWLRSALMPSDVLPTARGFYGGGGTGHFRGCQGFGTKGMRVEFYLDGNPFPAGLDAIGHLVPMRDVLAIEVYPDAQEIPGIWKTKRACAVVAVWTKHQ